MGILKVTKSFVKFLVLTCFLVNYASCGGITEEQIRKSTLMVKQVCIQKFKISDEVVAELNKKNYPEDRDVKCYVSCIMEMMGLTKKNKINYESVLKQIEIMLPDHFKEPTKLGLDMCKDSGKGIKDGCEAGYTIAKCMHEHNSVFFFV